MKQRSVGRRLSAILMSAIMTLLMLPAGAFRNTVEAIPRKAIVGLDTSVIPAPAKGNANDAWSGSYVWYGKYNGNPVRYRVLTPKTLEYNANVEYGTSYYNTMLLDCDTILYMGVFESDVDTIDERRKPNTFYGSDLRDGLNSFYEDSFSAQEKRGIAYSVIGEHKLTSGTNAGNVTSWDVDVFGNFVGLYGYSVFVLDCEEASNVAYGYYYDDNAVNSRRKKYNGQEKSWWLRSRVDASTTKAGAIRVGDGAVFTKEIDANDTGVSPAININLSRVLFVSIVSSGSNGPEYKLTVIDENGLSLQLQDHRSVTTSQDLIRVPYSLSGSTSSKVNQLSVLILDKEYSRENQNKATILGYQRMEPSNPDSKPEASGYGTFMLPSNLDLSDWGKSYHVYMTAEVINGKYETDYASAPVELPAPKSAAGLSTSAIAGPRTGQAGAAWHGNHVWFGKYDGFPIRYRVLDPNTNKYGVSTMLLDSDYILFNAPFDKDGIANEGLSKPNEWAYSELWWYLNGDDFLNNTNCFTSRERFAITGNRTTGHDLVSGTTAGCVSPSVKSTFGKYVPITSEPIFLLDVEDVSNIAYGYYYGAGNELSRMKIRIPKDESDDDLYPWLLRSASVGNNASVGKVCVEGEIETANVKNTEIGISPAFNLSRTEILFSTRVKALAGETAEYKLTLMDTFMMINVKQGEVVDFMGSDDGMTILVPYVLSGPSTNTVTNLSAMILDKEFKPGNANNAKVLRYEEMIPVESYSLETSGEAQFGLPHTFDLSGWNKDYFVYIFPEDINGVHETDYAGEPVLLPAPNAPVINTQPKDVRALVGEDVTFSVVTTGIGGLSYQWQSRKDDSSAWANSTRSGATTRKLTFKAAAGLNGWQFRCIATDANGRKTISRTARLTIVPGFVQEPTDLIVPAGSTAKFSVKACGVGPITYQWQSRSYPSGKWTNSGQQGAKTATLSVATNAGLNGWHFRCIITDALGESSASNEVELVLTPNITTQPTNTTVAAGSTAKFSVAVYGKGPLTYQWQSRKDSSSTWVNSGQPGARTATLSVASNAGLDGWQFRCRVTDANGMSATSSTAVMRVKTDTPKITKQPVNASVTAGSTAKFTVTAMCTKSMTYQWQSRKNSSTAWVNSGQSGAKTATLSVATNAGLNGYQFRCIVTAANGKTAISNVVTLYIIPKITKQPANTSVTAGSKATFTVTATGTGTLKYQWQSRKNSSATWVNSGQTGAKTAKLTVSTNAGLNGYQFRCIVTDGNGQKAESSTAILSIK